MSALKIIFRFYTALVHHKCDKGRGPKKKYVFLMVFLRIKKFTPIFFLEIESMIAKTNFTLGPIEKLIFFVKL